MKGAMIFKVCIVFPLVIFIDYVVMIMLGIISHVAGCGDMFYCGTFCTVGKVILGLSVILFFFPDIKEFVLKGKSSFFIKS
jgi:hypothetical protein